MPRFVPRERKHKRLARQSHALNHDVVDSNASEIIPSSPSEKEVRREALKQQLRDQQPQSKISSQKRKRLEKYVDTKLRKEENAELLSKLAAQQVDTSLLRSSKRLGRTQESKRERLQRALKERDAFGAGAEEEGVLFEPRRTVVPEELRDEGTSESDDGASDDEASDGDDIFPVLQTNGSTIPTFGSGLKRPLEVDETGQPVIRKRKRRKREIPFDVTDDQVHRHADENTNGQFSNDEQEDDEWHGFSETERDSASASEEESSEESLLEDEGTNETEESNSSNEPSQDEKPARISAFKAWADTQRNASLNFTPSAALSTTSTADAEIKANFKPRALSPDPLLDALPYTNSAVETSERSRASFNIERSAGVQQARLDLPVVQDEQKIIETINANPVTIICGATGSGKTTQVPQMLFENGYCSKGMIGITQPRRVAATSVADRVAYELGPQYKNRVSHQVRYDTNVSKSTAIKFMTDGILLREIQADFPLSKYSCIIIDEAHERSVNTDILIGILSRIVRLRSELAIEEPEKFDELKLVIMSATLRVNDFLQNERLFGAAKPPVVEVEGRQYAVTEHFARRTKRDYVSEMVEKVARGHRKLPLGGMLVFLTGQQEISHVAKRLRERLLGGSRPMWKNDPRGQDTVDDYEDGALDMGRADEFLDGEEDVSDADSDANIKVDAELDKEFAIPEDDQTNQRTRDVALKPHILQLYAALPALQQQKVFQSPPEGHRLIVLATNVAETSLTIPGIRYVFDSGRSKEKCYDHRTGVQTFEVNWISKASALQRQGRAGRTGPGGHVWRLYSSAVYEQFFAAHAVPEVLRTPLESVVLQLKGMEIDNIANFPFPTAPERKQLMTAEELLRNLGAIEGVKVTDSGRELMRFPLSPRFGRMLVIAKRYNVVSHAAALVAGLAVGDLYIPEAQANHLRGTESDEEIGTADQQKLHQAYTRAHATLSRWDDRSDAIKLLTTVAAHADAKKSGLEESLKFCKDFWLREKGMSEVQQLRQQLQSIISSHDNNTYDKSKTSLPPPTEKEITILNQVVAAGFIDQVAIRADMLKDDHVSFGRKPQRAIEVAYRTLIPTISDVDIDRNARPEEQEIQKSVFIHPVSVLARLSPREMPQYIVYSHLSRAPVAAVDGKQKKTRMHPLTAIGPKALAALAEGSPLLEFGKPVKIEELPERRRQCWVNVSLRADSGRSGWPLGTWKVVQKKRTAGEWNVEKVVARQ